MLYKPVKTADWRDFYCHKCYTFLLDDNLQFDKSNKLIQ
jgi:hypothetical protein